MKSMMMKTIPVLIVGLALIAGCQKQDAAPVAPAPVPAAMQDAGATAAPPSTTPARPPSRVKKTTAKGDGIFTGMTFPIAKADFITQINGRLRDNCRRPDRHGRLCPKLEQRSANCASAVKRPVVSDADAARDAGGKYLRCLHRGRM